MAERDPIKVYARNGRARRRVGLGVACGCGEQRPFALITGRTPPICFACDRIAHEREPYEWNHVFGKRNSEAQVRVPVNDHRAVLSVAQYSWPPETLANPHLCPLREAAARLRGRADVLQYMLDDSRASAERLEQLCAAGCQHHAVQGALRSPAPKKTPKAAVALKRRSKHGR